MNLENGNIYVTADYTIGSAVKNFYKVESNLGNMTQKSYKSISQSLDTMQLSTIEKSTIMNASELGDKYNALCNYVLSQCDLQGSEILNVTDFKSNSDALLESIITTLYNGEVFTISAKTSAPTTSNNSRIIDCLLSDEYLGQSVTITSRSVFKDFDNIVSAEG